MQSSSNGVTLKIYVKSLSRETKLVSEPDGTLIMHVAAPPTKGKANREIIKWLARKLRTPSSTVQMISGLHSTEKVILIVGMTEAEVAAKLEINH